MTYFEGFLIVVQENNFRAVQISPSEVQTTPSYFMGQDAALSEAMDREYSGIISHDKIRQAFYVTQKNQLVFICENSEGRIIYRHLSINLSAKKMLKLDDITVEQGPPKKLEKKLSKVIEQAQKVYSFHYFNRGGVPTLVLIKEQNVVEILENMQTVFIGQLQSKY